MLILLKLQPSLGSGQETLFGVSLYIFQKWKSFILCGNIIVVTYILKYNMDYINIKTR